MKVVSGEWWVVSSCSPLTAHQTTTHPVPVMLYSFFALAAQSPSQQRSFRRTVIVHLAVLIGSVWALDFLTGGVWGVDPRHPAAAEAAALLGYVLLIAGIVEGATLLGWRLTQLPKTQALEFLLVTPLRPRRVFFAEACVGLARLALVTLAGLPVLALLTLAGCLNPIDLLPLLVMPFTWGTVTGLGLAAWAYEPRTVRRWAERGVMLLVLVYLVIGMLAGEHLKDWLGGLPMSLQRWCLNSFEAVHRYNPFSVLKYWLQPAPSEQGEPLIAGNRNLGVERGAWERAWAVQVSALAVIGILLARAASRLHGHFQDRHYRPIAGPEEGDRGRIGDRPLSWWAVRRVTEYAGRVNLWLAAGFAVVYAAFTVADAGGIWPAWLGRRVFEICDLAGGIPTFATALVVLAAVPAAFQYGLWDSNSQDRCRRLELLLLTGLEARDYWEASTAAAWRRGRGYFFAGVLLWLAAVISAAWSAALQARAAANAVAVRPECTAVLACSPTAGFPGNLPWGALQLSSRPAAADPEPYPEAATAWEAAWAAGRTRALQMLAALAAGVILWGLSFALSFRAFSRGHQANGLGMVLTLGFPLLTVALYRAGWPALAALLPPGSVYQAAAGMPSTGWMLGPLLAGLLTLVVARMALAHGDADMRRWYDLHHGQRVLE
jgi:hypothetical protein